MTTSRHFSSEMSMYHRQISRQNRADTPSTSPPVTRRQPLLQRSLSTPAPKRTSVVSTAAEVCGGITAECAAIWCCCPCGLVNLLVLAIYKVPAGLYRRALRRRRRKRLTKRGMLPPPANGGDPNRNRIRSRCLCGCCDLELAIHPVGSLTASEDDDDYLELKIIGKDTEEEDEAVAALEKEMWNRFYGAGFWRSPSQRETVSSSPRRAKTGQLGGPLQREAVVMASPRASIPGVLRTGSTTGTASPKQ